MPMVKKSNATTSKASKAAMSSELSSNGLPESGPSNLKSAALKSKSPNEAKSQENGTSQTRGRKKKAPLTTGGASKSSPAKKQKLTPKTDEENEGIVSDEPVIVQKSKRSKPTKKQLENKISPMSSNSAAKKLDVVDATMGDELPDMASKKPAKNAKKARQVTKSTGSESLSSPEKKKKKESAVLKKRPATKKSTPKQSTESAMQLKVDEGLEPANVGSDSARETDEETSKKPKSKPAKAASKKTKTTDGREYNVKISTWNVGGLRAWLKKGCQQFLFQDGEEPDMFFGTETKIGEKDLKTEMLFQDSYPYAFFSHTDPQVKKGYAGVVLYSKIKPLDVTYGLGMPEHDKEGRMITAEFEKFYLVCAYVPNSSRGLVRLDYRQRWNVDFLKFIKNLDAKKPVIYCGDLNVAYEEIDLTNPKTNRRNAGFTDEERGDFKKLIDSGFVDTFRSLYPNKTGAYTFWSNLNNAREKNIGWRLDYFLVSKRFEKDICDQIIHKDVMGSDHCPVTLLMAI